MQVEEENTSSRYALGQFRNAVNSIVITINTVLYYSHTKFGNDKERRRGLSRD